MQETCLLLANLHMIEDKKTFEMQSEVQKFEHVIITSSTMKEIQKYGFKFEQTWVAEMHGHTNEAKKEPTRNTWGSLNIREIEKMCQEEYANPGVKTLKKRIENRKVDVIRESALGLKTNIELKNCDTLMFGKFI